MVSIRSVSILGANGFMGAGCGGLIASFGEARVFMIARTLEKAKKGIDEAVASVRSEIIRDQLVPLTYDESYRCLPESDWIFETVTESESVKAEMNALISAHASNSAILSTNTSGISIEKLSNTFTLDQRARYMGTHFFNPPYRMPLCELIAHGQTDPTILEEFGLYLRDVLYRRVISTTIRKMPRFVAHLWPSMSRSLFYRGLCSG